jgi:alpha-1,2-mannosyltransferase
VPDGIAVNTVIGNLVHTSAIWPYPPQTAFLFAPFGAVPLTLGVPALHAFVLAAAVRSLVLAARLVGLEGARLACVLLLAVRSQPFIVSIRAGHPIAVVLAALLLVFVGLRDGRLWALAAGVAVASVKPQLAIAFGLAVFGVVAVKRDWRALGAVVVALVAVTVPAELRTPLPFAQLLGTGNEWLNLDLSTVWALARDLGGGTVLSILLTLLALASTALAASIGAAGSRSTLVLGGLLALSLILTPYAHDYDMLLVLPAVFSTVAVARDGRAGFVGLGLAVAFIGVLPWLLFLWWPLLGEGSRTYQGGPLGALPILVAVTLPIAAWIGRRAARTATE